MIPGKNLSHFCKRNHTMGKYSMLTQVSLCLAFKLRSRRKDSSTPGCHHIPHHARHILTYQQRILLLRPSHRQVYQIGAHEEVVSQVSCQWVCLRPAAAAADQASCQCALSLQQEQNTPTECRAAPGQILLAALSNKDERELEFRLFF